ncbi:hypothetical protein H4S08_001294 [Coemansia sp. RSA 1365]|nr:hypothetical protein H4S08_001294 [Coemansia sp. RSA 1365]
MKITSAFIAIAALAGMGVEAQSTCTTNAVRKEIRSLTQAEWTRTQTVMNSMNERGWIQWFAYIHTAYFNVIHNCEFFFPFHRRFLQEFENTGRRFDANFALPYWDEVRDYANPAASTVLSASYTGTNGVGSDQCVRDGLQGATTLTYPNNHCLRRQYNNGNSINPFYSPEYIQSLLSRSTTMSQLRPAIEFSLHGAVHLALGGDMLQNYSPNDFVFWLHHTNIDRLWFVWQMQNPQQNFWSADGKDVNGNAIGLQTEIPNFSDPIINTMYPGRNGMCFSYDNFASISKRSLQTRTKKCGASNENLIGDILGAVDGLVGNVLDDVNNILTNSEELVKSTVTKLLPAPMLGKWFPTLSDNNNVTYTKSDIPQAPIVADVLSAVTSQSTGLYAPDIPSDSFNIAGYDDADGDYSAPSSSAIDEDYTPSDVEFSSASGAESVDESSNEANTDSLVAALPSDGSGEYDSSAAEEYSADDYHIFSSSPAASGIDGSELKYPMPNPFPFSRGFIQMHKYSVEDIKKHYALAMEFVGDMNSNSYQSPFAKGAQSLI